MSVSMAGTTRRHFISTAASAPLLRSWPAAAAPAPGTCLSKVRIGAEFFLNRTETSASVHEHFQRMAETGLTIARIFTLWDQIEREQGTWDFSGYDWIYDAAAKNGILIANTLCSEDPPGWMGTAPFYHQWRDLSNPELRKYSEIYIERWSRGTSHPAHGVWLLQNEPGIPTAAARTLIAGYRSGWKKYRTVEKLNKALVQEARSDSRRRRPAEEPRTAGWADYASNLDWRRFPVRPPGGPVMWLRSRWIAIIRAR